MALVLFPAQKFPKQPHWYLYQQGVKKYPDELSSNSKLFMQFHENWAIHATTLTPEF